jgi:DNA polymerase I
MADGNHLYLVDGSSYIFRAYHRLPPLTNRHGAPAGAVYGYTTMLWKLAEGLNKAEGPTHMAVILDKSEQTFRNEMYDQYKAHRPPPPEDLVPQFPLIRDATRAFSIPCIEEEGLEADDIIACYVTAAKKAGWKVTIVSSDKDLMQLIEDGRVDMLDTMNDRRIDSAYVREKFGVGPETLGEVLALMGDKVDNIPGVPGIGPKTASQLILEHGSLEAVLANAETIARPKLKQSLIDHAEAARLSRRLVELVCDAPLPQPLEELQLTGIPPEPLKAFLEEQGFKSLLARLTGGAAPTSGRSSSGAGLDLAAASIESTAAGPAEPETISVDRSKYETVTDADSLDRWIADAKAKGYVALDTETDCIDCVIASLPASA